MSYIVIARKFRPKDFDEVIGQEHITTTLKNAIALERVAHAYLFSGPRGIGKTSSARILAKALNCEKGPTPEPCNKCNSCEEISRGSSLDVIEIDGASNRGIEEVRALRENVKFAPAKGKFKVYIIDEVHMLTQEAFNALLKTLEEPPAHVKFVFATTAPNKVPPTILSRCQRFDFRRIPTQEIVKKLKEISKKEKISIEEEALYAVARAADGSIRDAESILDQLATFPKKTITLQDLSALLGTIKEEQLFEITQKIIERDAAGSLAIVDGVLNEGKDLILFLQALIEHFRNLMVAKVAKDAAGLIERSKDIIERIARQSQGFSLEEILYAAYLLSNALEATKRSLMMRLPIEMALVKLSRREDVISLDDILKKLDELSPEVSIPQRPAPEKEAAEVAAVEETPVPTADNAAEPVSEGGSVDIPASPADIEQVWLEAIQRVKAISGLCGTLLDGSVPTRLENNKLTVSFPKELAFNKESLEKKDNIKLIEKVLFDITGKTLHLGLELSGNIAYRPQNSGVAAQPQAGGGGSLADEPVLKSVLKTFKGNIVRID